jgi:hypothetical protein
LRLQVSQEAARNVLIVFAVPKPTEIAIGVFQLIEGLIEVVPASGLGSSLPCAEEIAQPMDGDESQPTAEGAGASVVLKVR